MGLEATDSEYYERLKHFINEEVTAEPDAYLDPATRHLAVIAALIGCGGIDAFCEFIPTAMENGVTPVMIKETVYQATDYLGYGRVLPFLKENNRILEQSGIKLPLPSQSNTTIDNRLEKGVEAQAEIFGESMREAWKKGR